MNPGEIPGILGSAIALSFAIVAGRRLSMWRDAEWVILFSLLGALLALAPTLGPLALAVCSLLYYALLRGNAYKIDLTKTPIMPRDFSISLRNPQALFDVFAMSRQTGWTLLAALAFLLALLCGAVIYFDWLRSSMEFWPFRAGLILLAAGHAWIYRRRFIAHVQNHIETKEYPFGPYAYDELLSWKEPIAAWTPMFNARLSEQLGIIAFLVFKKARPWTIETLATRHADLDVIRQEEILRALPRYETADPLPNIMVVQLESICNPNWAFGLQQPFECSLFEPNPLTRFLAPLRVNTVGGGSWISEFEFITGLDVRLFGDDGSFTHVALPSYLARTLPMYLKERGYSTNAFMSAEGNFYNCRQAYAAYGFDRFWDTNDLSLPRWQSSDTMMAEAVRLRCKEFGAHPFLAFVVTNGAHSPFGKLSPAESDYNAEFLSGSHPHLGKIIETYARLARNSARAVEDLREFLQRIEAETGRPFVLLAYGDHQPWEFTQGDKTGALDVIRTRSPKNQTFAHLMASKGFAGLGNELPLTALAPVISMFVEKEAEKLFLPVTFYLHDKVGPNLFGTLRHSRREIAALSASLEGNTQDRAAAEQRTIDWIKSAGYLRLS